MKYIYEFHELNYFLDKDEYLNAKRPSDKKISQNNLKAFSNTEFHLLQALEIYPLSY